jgi:hypothetical protein
MNDSSRSAPGISAFRIFAPLIIALILAGIIYAFGYHGKHNNFEELALGEATHAFYAKYDNVPVHCSDLRDMQLCLDGFDRRGGHRAALWLGNSQLHAINQYQAGEENGPAILFRQLKSRGLDLLTFSQPNANLQEHYVLFTYLQKRLPIQLLILPVVFDDMREDGIRPTIASALRDSSTTAVLETTDIGNRILANNILAVDDEGKETAGVRDTIQEYSEKALNNWLNKNFSAWADRVEMRGSLFVELYKLRNFLFGIKATSKRRIIKARYIDNLAALQAMLSRASELHIDVLLYVVPLRNDVESPYDESEYKRFKQDIKTLAEANRAELVNLEDVVPANFWGEKASTTLNDDVELDFMHFQGAGHELLATALHEAIKENISRLGR